MLDEDKVNHLSDDALLTMDASPERINPRASRRRSPARSGVFLSSGSQPSIQA
jgi:hypothetical protein